MKMIFSAKDILATRKDFKECGIQLHLWLYPIRVRFIKSITSYVLTNEEKNRFVQIILNLKTFIKIMPSLKKKVHKDENLKGMKSHDFHILTQDKLPLCM
jgi:ABC-type Zn2+ transport system substrate-binding protein/surface adhesin